MEKTKRQHTLMIGASLLLSIITGFILFRFIEIPFGSQFHLSLYCFIICFIFFLLSIALYCFRKKKTGFKWLGALPILLSIILVLLTIIIRTDYRILYFQSLSPKPTKTQWIEDLHYFKNQMIERHCNIQALINVKELEDSVKAIEKRIPRLSDSDIVMELFKLTAMPNDAHTFPFIMMPCFDLHTFPIQVYELDDGWTIVEAGRNYKELIGSRILKIGSYTMQEIYESFPLFLSTESEYGYKLRFTYMCFMAEWLYYHDLIKNIHEAELTVLKPDGQEIQITMPTIKFYPHFLWSSMFTIDNNAPPVYANPRKDFYRFELLNKHNALYIQFNQCVNQPGRETMNEFVERLEQFVQTHEFQYCMVDLRNNDGGSDIWQNLVTFIRDNKKINQHGRLFVLTSRRTFSSAVLFANQLQTQTDAVLIGEPTGQGPIFYAGPYLVELPNSRLVFSVSTYHAVSGFPFDKRNSLIPDIPVAYTSEDFIKRRDPVLEKAFSANIPEKEERELSISNLKNYVGRYLLNPVYAIDVTLNNASLDITYTDFIPGSLQRFHSKLYPESSHSFSAKIPDLTITFNSYGRMTINWQGKIIELERASKDHVLAMESFSKNDIEAGCKAIRQNKSTYTKYIPNLERMLNSMGYNFMREENLKSALLVFQLNTELYPESYNVYDSYGEALLKNRDKKEAIKNYKTSLLINPGNENGKRMLKQLEEKI